MVADSAREKNKKELVDRQINSCSIKQCEVPTEFGGRLEERDGVFSAGDKHESMTGAVVQDPSQSQPSDIREKRT